MEWTFYTDLVLSHALDGNAIHHCCMDGVGNTRVDGFNTRLLPAEIEAISIIDRGGTGPDRAGAACACLSKDQCWLDRIARRGMGRCIVAASEYVRHKTLRVIPDRHSFANHHCC